MAKITREQFDKWSAQLPQGWKFDLQKFVMWGEKQVFTDGPADDAGTFYRLTLRYHEETTGKSWMSEKTGYMLPRVSIDRYNETTTPGMYTVVGVYAETVGEKQKKRNYNYLAELAAGIDPQSFFAKAAEKDTGRTWYTIGLESGELDDETPTEAAPEPVKAADETPTEAAQEAAPELVEETDEAPTEAADAAQETPTEAEPEPVEAVQEAVPEPVDETDEAPTAPGYSFAELAAAYIAGRTVKAKPREEAKPEPTPEPVEAAQETAPEPTPEPIPEPEPAPAPGYSGNANALFTDEERQALTAGNVVISGKGYRREAYFTAHYSEGVRLVYSVYAGDVRDRINPGTAPRYVGFMVGPDLYTNAKGIAEKLREDINARLLALVPDEETAESLTGNVEEWSRAEFERLKVQSYTGAARDLFYRGEKPALILYTETPQDINDLIQYIQEPERVIELYALEHMSARPETIYKSWIRYNREQAEYNALANDPSREEHEWLRIARAIGEQKTVRVLLECGEEVRVEASAVKRVPYNRSIYDTWVVASDRHKLRGANGRTRDIDASEIVRISHGNRVLYQRAAKLEKKTA